MSRGVATRFSAAAGTYQGLADVQRHVAERLVDMLARWVLPPGPDCAVDIGCGTGLLAQLLRERYPGIRLVGLDIAPGMVHEARRLLGSGDGVQWLVADGRQMPFCRRFPLAVSSAALHWMPPWPEAFRSVASIVEPGGALAAAVMVEGTLSELHEARRMAAPDKAPPARLPRPGELALAVLGSGFNIQEKFTESFRERYPSARAFLRHIHDQGLTSGDYSVGPRLMNRGDLRRLENVYDRCFVDGGGVYATYRVWYVMGKRCAPSL